MIKKKILILGSTGSIGQQTLQVIEENQDKFEIEGLICNQNIELISKQAQKFGIKKIGVTDKNKYQKENKNWYWGEEEIQRMIKESEAEMVVMAISGAKSLKPTLMAIKSGKDIALASKEVMVLAGELINQELKKNKVKMMPIDSEHSAIWQCLRSGRKDEIEKIILTCSGGPFLNLDKNEFKKITVKKALHHPNWKMGKRITIDCATLINKGLEFIEAKWLFSLTDDQIEIVIHPQSLIHSAVQYKDGSIMAQIGNKDMRIPIQYALTYPSRIKNNLKRIDWFNSKMDFYRADLGKFPCLKYALEAAKIGGTMPVVLNAADEVAVDLFLRQKIKFIDIPKIIEKALEQHKLIKKPNLEQILEIDKLVRETAGI